MKAFRREKDRGRMCLYRVTFDVDLYVFLQGKQVLSDKDYKPT